MTTPQESIELLKDSIDQTTQQLAAKVIRLRVLHERAVERPLVTRADAPTLPHDHAEHEEIDLHDR
jgi:hypothetical protein